MAELELKPSFPHSVPILSIALLSTLADEKGFECCWVRPSATSALGVFTEYWIGYYYLQQAWS